MTSPWQPYDDGNRASSPYEGQAGGGPPPPSHLFDTGEFTTGPVLPRRVNRKTLLLVVAGAFSAILIVAVGVLVIFAAPPQHQPTAIHQLTATATIMPTCTSNAAGCVAATVTPIPGATATATFGPGTPTPTPEIIYVYPTVPPQPHLTATPKPHSTPTKLPTATPVPVVTEIDDSAIGTGPDQFNYSGNGWTHFTLCNGCYSNTASWDNTTGESVTFTFTGYHIQLLCQLGNNQGFMRIQLDSTVYPNFDTYSASTEDQQPCFDSGNLARGTHTLTLAVIGAHDASATDNYISIDATIITS